MSLFCNHSWIQDLKATGTETGRYGHDLTVYSYAHKCTKCGKQESCCFTNKVRKIKSNKPWENDSSLHYKQCTVCGCSGD